MRFYFVPNIWSKLNDPYANYVIVFDAIRDGFREINNINDRAIHFTWACNELVERVLTSEQYINEIERNRNRYRPFLSDQHTLPKFQSFRDTLYKMIEFTDKVSKTDSLMNFQLKEEIEKKFFELIDEFDEVLRKLDFPTIQYKKEKFNQFLRNDFKEYIKFFENKPVTTTIESGENSKGPMTTTTGSSGNSKGQVEESIVAIFPQKIDISEYKVVYEKQGTRIKAMAKRSDKNSIYAFKKLSSNISTKSKEYIIQKTAVLQRFSESSYIISFYGIAEHNRESFIVTEWARYGSLKEYYRIFGPLEWYKKIEFALDICRGLSFLHSSGILHHDVCSENVLILENRKAKISNLEWVKESEKSTTMKKLPTETLRYMAPEKMNTRNLKYNVRCEIFSYGMLLWEIAEEKVPYSDEEDFKVVRKLVTENKRENFSSNASDEWKNLFEETTHHEPEKRPAMSEICQTLLQLHKRHQQGHESQEIEKLDSPLPMSEFDSNLEFDDAIFKSVISLEDAIKESRKEDGDIEKAWKSFNVYAEYDVPIAKFWMGRLLYDDKILFSDDKERDERKLQDAANYFKESADENVADAQFYYANCLEKGKGVNKNIRKACEYYKKSADNGNICGMYSYGYIIYNGYCGTKNIEEGLKYMKMAADNGHKRAMKSPEQN
ncbi:2968_t:CDS:2 [Acaulospora morrowiae]|uniref:2968_t:CDS:1 n=1 Tax=Acaulospora morrowiae TaxID=94023 RepID=A0A9N8ZTL6_9GLOM|nr:2968_t:CDS:2 [Acaulospora morrowiae]